MIVIFENPYLLLAVGLFALWLVLTIIRKTVSLAIKLAVLAAAVAAFFYYLK